MTHGKSISFCEEGQTRYSRGYKAEALALADRVGINAAALPESFAFSPDSSI